MIREKQFVSPVFAVPGGIARGEYTRYFAGDRARCHYCGRQTFYKGTPEAQRQPFCMRTVDHKLARSRGGGDNQVVIACQGCNSLKADSPYDVFRAWCSLPGNDTWAPTAGKSYRGFVYDCAHAGLKAATDLAAWMKRQEEPKASPVIEAFERFKASRAA